MTPVVEGLNLHAPRDELAGVFAFFDRHKTGKVQYHSLLRAIRGYMSEYRLALADKTFDYLASTTGGGPLTVQAVVQSYNPPSSVAAGSHSVVRLLSELPELFEIHCSLTVCYANPQTKRAERGGAISREQFIDFYDYVSAVLQTDAEFVLVSQKVWSRRAH